jgi:hypothetical protein
LYAALHVSPVRLAADISRQFPESKVTCFIKHAGGKENDNLKKLSKYVETTRNTDYQQANLDIYPFLAVY